MTAKKHLFEGETFTFSKILETTSIEASDEDIDEKYKKGEIRIVTEQARYPLDNIPVMLASGKYKLNPEYQRRKRWDNQRKSRLIESFIMNVPIPPIFLYEVEYSEYEVMDGLQRLTTIADFYGGNFRLSGLQYWRELNGKTYDELPTQVRKGVDRRYLSSIVLLQETAKSPEEAENLKQIVFERLNSGGEALEPQETRNAHYNGDFNQLCNKLARNDEFRELWHIPLESDGEKKLLSIKRYREMEDVELVLRFFALRHVDELKGALDSFLDAYLKQANQFSTNLLLKMTELFSETISLVHTTLGKSAFFIPTKERRSKTPVKTIYDPMMQSFATNLKYKNLIIERAPEIRTELYLDISEFMQNKEKGSKTLFDGKYNNANDIKLRIEYFNTFLSKFTS